VNNPIDSTAGKALAPDPPMARGGWKRLLLPLKLTVTAGIFAWVFSRVSWADIRSVLIASNAWLLLASMLLRFSSMALSAYKWKLLLDIHGLNYRMSQIHRWFYTASFLNLAFPTSIGGDAYRIYKTLKNPKHRACAVLAVFMHRLTGMVSWLCIGYAAILLVYLRTGDPLMKTLSVAGGVFGVAGLIALVAGFRHGIADRLSRQTWCPTAVASLIRYSGDYRRDPFRMMMVAVVSVLFHLQRVFFVWLIICALGYSFNITSLAASMLGADMVALLPISLGGLGLMDGSLMYLLSHYGLPGAAGLSTALLNRILDIPWIILGGLFYAMERSLPASGASGAWPTAAPGGTARRESRSELPEREPGS
jgi:uncharacterized protein (TIRG00374 family)